jgi:hypothetical protein
VSNNNSPLHQVVLEAVNLAQAASWKVSVRDGLVRINPPGLDENGKTYPVLTINMQPNAENLKSWAPTARKFGLTGNGPAMTPVQKAQAAAAKTAALQTEQAQTRAEAQQKAAEKAAAAEKVAAATAAGRTDNPTNAALFVEPVAVRVPEKKPMAKPAAPVGDGFPSAFEEWMLDAPANRLQITGGSLRGRFFCPQCFQGGEKFTATNAQGLAAHRGFKHSRFANKPNSEVSAMVSAVLPESVRTALELLQNEVADQFLKLQEDGGGAAKDGQIAELRKKVSSLETELVRMGKDYTSMSALAQERANALSTVQSKLDSEALAATTQQTSMLKSFEVLLRELRTMTQTMSPVQAAAAIDKKVEDYLS